MKHLAKAAASVVACAALLLPALLARAQGTSDKAAAAAATPLQPADPRATVPPLIYRSAFRGYRPNSEAKPGDWKAANETVARIGGWRAYADEAAQPDTAASAPAAPRAHHHAH